MLVVKQILCITYISAYCLTEKQLVTNTREKFKFTFNSKTIFFDVTKNNYSFLKNIKTY